MYVRQRCRWRKNGYKKECIPCVGKCVNALNLETSVGSSSVSFIIRPEQLSGDQTHIKTLKQRFYWTVAESKTSWVCARVRVCVHVRTHTILESVSKNSNVYSILHFHHNFRTSHEYEVAYYYSTATA